MLCEVNFLGGVSAIGFGALISVANLVLVPTGFPPPGTEVARATRFFFSWRAVLALSSAACPAAWAMAVMFGAAVVVATQRRASDAGMAWALFGFAGLLLQTAAFAVVIALRLALGKTRGEAAQTLWPLHDAVIGLNGAFLAFVMIGLNLAGSGAGLVSPWHAAVGFASATLLFTSGTLTPLVVERGGRLGWIGLAGWLAWVVWLVWYGVSFLADGAC